MDELWITLLPQASDERGLSVSVLTSCLAWVQPVQDLHFASIRPGAIRGNHVHTGKREVIAVVATGRWSLHWDTGSSTEPRQRTFAGDDAVLVEIPPLWAHAIRNESDADLWIVAVSDRVYDPGETSPRRLAGSL